MIRFIGKLPRETAVAVSGGPDSMAVLDFLIRGGRNITVAYFNHGTEHGAVAESMVTDFCNINNIRLIIGNISRGKEKKESPQEFWRNERYRFFNSLENDLLIMAHQLDDQVENWIFTSLTGRPRLIPYRRGRVIRPFLLTRKSILKEWCDRKSVPYVIDPSNFSSKYMRSMIRKEMMPIALRVNPGIHKVISKKVVLEYEKEEAKRRLA